MSASEPPMDEYVHVDEIEDVIEQLDDRIDTIESDNRYPSGEDEEAAEVQVNAVLALMQCEWRGELGGLKTARSKLSELV